MSVEISHDLYMKVLEASKKRMPVGFSDDTMVYLWVRAALLECLDKEETWKA